MTFELDATGSVARVRRHGNAMEKAPKAEAPRLRAMRMLTPKLVALLKI